MTCRMICRMEDYMRENELVLVVASVWVGRRADCSCWFSWWLVARRWRDVVSWTMETTLGSRGRRLMGWNNRCALRCCRLLAAKIHLHTTTHIHSLIQRLRAVRTTPLSFCTPVCFSLPLHLLSSYLSEKTFTNTAP